MPLGFGCMRLSTAADRNESRALETLAIALAAGIELFDTAHAYGLSHEEAGHNERLLSRAISASGRSDVRIVTKVGLRRAGSGYRPDGRAKAIFADATDAAAALHSHSIDILLLHAPDPATSLETSVRALARAQSEGLTRAIGLSNVNLGQLQAALRIAPIAAVEVALGAFDDAALRGGLIRFCVEHGIEVLAHSPLGGPTRAMRLARDPLLVELARTRGDLASPIEVVLAYLGALSPHVVPIPGATQRETAVSVVRARQLVLDEATMVRLDERFPTLGEWRRPHAPASPRPDRDAAASVVLLTGISGSGKSRAASAFVDRGYVRLNRDERGGTLRGLSRALDERLAAGCARIVLDNTYLTRASRYDVLAVAARHGVPVHCVHHDTPSFEAQVNVVLRMVARRGALLSPEQLEDARRLEPDLGVLPNVLHRHLRELELPAMDEGFAAVDVVPFRRELTGERTGGALVALDALIDAREAGDFVRDDAASVLMKSPEGAPILALGWRPALPSERVSALEEQLRELAGRVGRIVDLFVCTHPAGPPTCWCRPPLPGAWLEFSERRLVAPTRSRLLAGGTALTTMARGLGFATDS